MKVLLHNADGTPALVESSEPEKLMALAIYAFGLISGMTKREQATVDRWLALAVEVVGVQRLEKNFPGLKIHKNQGGIH